MKKVILEVSADGEVTIEAVGFKGPACEKATKALEESLGTVKSRKKKPEYHQAQVNVQTA
jgi:hypothetical protein